MFIIRLFVLFIAAWAVSNSVKGQSELQIDSLQDQLKQTQQLRERLKITILLSEKYMKVNPLKALGFANESVEKAKQIHSDSMLSQAYLYLANIYLHLANYPRALQFYQNSVSKASQISDDMVYTRAYANIGTIYYHEHDYDNALKHYKEALKYSELNGSPLDKTKAQFRANVLNNIGIIYEETKQFKEASSYYETALALGRRWKDHEVTAIVLNNQGTLYRDQGDNKKAFELYREAMELRKTSHDKLGLARSYHNLGQFYFEQLKDYEKAEEHLKSAIDLSREISAWGTVSSAYSLLYEVYKIQGKYQKALEALEHHQSVNDSLFSSENTKKITQLEMQFEFDRQQNLKASEQKQRELYYSLGALLLLVLLLIVTLLFLFQKSKTRKSQLKEAHLQLEKISLQNNLATKDKELATNIMYLLNKNELINTISEKLLNIKMGMATEFQPAIQKIVLDLQSNLQPEMWQEFEFRFQQVHEKFYQIINEKYPYLSPSERRLCAFLKLNMTTKEISAITHQNAKSIDVARTRLRKKLNLTGTDQNLVNFLVQLDQAEVIK